MTFYQRKKVVNFNYTMVQPNRCCCAVDLSINCNPNPTQVDLTVNYIFFSYRMVENRGACCGLSHSQSVSHGI